MYWKLHLNVIGFDPFVTEETFFKQQDFSKVDLDELLANSDYVSVHCPVY